jgi:hypothetical protein
MPRGETPPPVLTAVFPDSGKIVPTLAQMVRDARADDAASVRSYQMWKISWQAVCSDHRSISFTSSPDQLREAKSGLADDADDPHQAGAGSPPKLCRVPLPSRLSYGMSRDCEYHKSWRMRLRSLLWRKIDSGKFWWRIRVRGWVLRNPTRQIWDGGGLKHSHRPPWPSRVTSTGCPMVPIVRPRARTLRPSVMRANTAPRKGGTPLSANVCLL